MIAKVLFILLSVILLHNCVAADTNENVKKAIQGLTGVNSASDLIPVVVATVFPNHAPVSYKANCFSNNTVSFSSFSSSGGVLNFEIANPASKTCFDLYLITTGKQFKVTYFFMKGNHKYELKWADADEAKIAETMGVLIFKISSNMIDVVKNGFTLYEAFYKGDVKHIRQVLEERLEKKFHDRAKPYIEINWNRVHSGDFLPVFKLNNIEGYIIAAIGGMSGHVSMMMRDPDNPKDLYVVEAQPETGVKMTPIAIWFETMHNGSYDNCHPDVCSAALLPLSDEARKAFDERKAWNYIKASLGKPYIQNGEFYSFVDSADPAAYKEPLSPSFFFVASLVMERFKTTQGAAKVMLLDGINRRLNKKFTTMDQALRYCEDAGINILNVFAMPELDSYTYDVEGYKEPQAALMCSSTIARIYKASGLFDYYISKEMGIPADKYNKKLTDDLINGQEFTPRDLYEMKIFNGTNTFPDCRGYDNLPYCQLIGQLLMELDTFNTVPIYPHMNENCYNMRHYPDGC